MSSTDQGRQAAEFCAELVRSHDFTRYASTLFLPPDQRRGLLAIYAFNAEISRVRELVSQPLPAEMRLQWWTDMLVGEDHGGVKVNPVAAELNLAIRNWDLPVERLSRLVGGLPVELENHPIATLANLASAIKQDAARFSQIKHLYLMGGAYWLDRAEHNIKCDPEAAKIVFESGIRITAIGLDLTLRVLLNVQDLRRIAQLG